MAKRDKEFEARMQGMISEHDAEVECLSLSDAIDAVNRVGEECGNPVISSNDLEIIGALPSLYPLQDFEEKAIQRVVESNDDGWIPCSESLPENNKNVLAYAKSTARQGDTCFVGSCDNGFWFLQNSIGTLSYPTQYEIIAWRPLPALYQQKGE